VPGNLGDVPVVVANEGMQVLALGMVNVGGPLVALRAGRLRLREGLAEAVGVNDRTRAACRVPRERSVGGGDGEAGERGGKVGGLDLGPLREGERVAQGVLQLADVAGPDVGAKGGQGPVGQVYFSKQTKQKRGRAGGEAPP